MSLLQPLTSEEIQWLNLEPIRPVEPGDAVKKHVRKDLRMLTEAEWATYGRVSDEQATYGTRQLGSVYFEPVR